MIVLTRTQTAGKEHVCDECGLAIHEGDRYDRVAQFESWDDVGRTHTPVFSDTTDVYWRGRVWKAIARSKNVLILKFHEGEHAA